MQCGDGSGCDCPEHREVELVGVEMQYIEILRELPHAVKHEHVIRNRILNSGIKTQGLWHAGDKVGCSDRIAACEQRHFMPQGDEFLREIRDDALGAAV